MARRKEFKGIQTLVYFVEDFLSECRRDALDRLGQRAPRRRKHPREQQDGQDDRRSRHRGQAADAGEAVDVGAEMPQRQPQKQQHHQQVEKAFGKQGDDAPHDDA